MRDAEYRCRNLLLTGEEMLEFLTLPGPRTTDPLPPPDAPDNRAALAAWWEGISARLVHPLPADAHAAHSGGAIFADSLRRACMVRLWSDAWAPLPEGEEVPVLAIRADAEPPAPLAMHRTAQVRLLRFGDDLLTSLWDQRLGPALPPDPPQTDGWGPAYYGMIVRKGDLAIPLDTQVVGLGYEWDWGRPLSWLLLASARFPPVPWGTPIPAIAGWQHGGAPRALLHADYERERRRW